MPNKEGEYGDSSQPRAAQHRRVNVPGSGSVRRGVSPADPGPRLQDRPSAPQRHVSAPPHHPERRVPSARPPRRTQPQPDIRLLLAGTAAGILLLAGVITLLLPGSSGVQEVAAEPEAGQTSRLIAPVPYANAEEGGSAITINWGTIGPVEQSGSVSLTSVPAADSALPAFGRVTTDWFSDAAFLGDSLTSGLAFYGVNVGDALVLGYEGASPNQIVNRTALVNTNADNEEQVPLDLLSERQPAKLYLLIGTNALAGTGNDEGFLAYYARLLDELQAIMPNTMIFVQSVLNVRPEALESAPGLTPERLAQMNADIQAMCSERGLYYLNLNEAFTGEDGYLLADYAQSDGIHLTVSGYTHWIDYLCTHVPYSKNNPYQQGSDWYLSDELKNLISDLP